MNSARRTGRLSHPVSAPAAAFLFSPGGAAAPPVFVFTPALHGALPVSGPARRGLPGPGLSPRPHGFLSCCFWGCFRGCRPSGAPVAHPPPAAAGGARLAVLPGRAAVFPAEPPFLPACPPLFGPNLLFRSQRRVQAFYRLHDVCTLRRQQGCTVRLWGPAGAVSLRVSPRPRAVAFLSTPPRFFAPLYKREKNQSLCIKARAWRERERERERERRSVYI